MTRHRWSLVFTWAAIICACEGVGAALHVGAFRGLIGALLFYGVAVVLHPSP